MSQDLENNKIIAAILVAGIVAMLGGFVAKKLVHGEAPEKAAFEINTSALEAAASGGGAPAGPEPILALLATADIAKGEALSKACVACHSFEQGGPNKIGPNLYGIVNNKKAHAEGFAYSDTIKEMGAKGDTWTYHNLGAFLWKPGAYAKGTKMAFPGLKKPQDRANVIAYLRTLAGSPAALPSQTEIDAETPKDDPAAKTADALKTEKKEAASVAKTEERKADDSTSPNAKDENIKPSHAEPIGSKPAEKK